MAATPSSEWPVGQLRTKTTTGTFRTGFNGEWTPERARLHEQVVTTRLRGKASKEQSTIWVVIGGVGSGKSSLIRSDLAPRNPGAVVIDADQLWGEIPEYEALAAADWKTAGDRTYQEVRYLRDAMLAEAAARRLDIILEAPGDESTQKVADRLERDGYEVGVTFVECSPEEARERITRRANTSPTAEDNLLCSPANPDFPDKFDYQNVDFDAFLKQYEARKVRRSAI